MAFSTWPTQIDRYDKHILYEAVTMSAACAEADPINIKSDGTGILADSTDTTKPCHGFASRAVSAADITAGGSRAQASLYTRCRIVGGVAGTKGARVYVKASSSLGACLTETQPITNAHLVQAVGVIAPDGLSILARAALPLVKFQTSGNSTAGLA